MNRATETTFSAECGAQLTITPGEEGSVIELSINQASVIQQRESELNFRNGLPLLVMGDENRAPINSRQVNLALRVHLQYCLDADLLHFMAVMAAAFNRWSSVITSGVTDLLAGLGFNKEAVDCFREAVKPFASAMDNQYA